MTVTASQLRGNIYRLLDRTLQTGEAIEVKRRGQVLKIVAQKPESRLARLVRHRCIKGDPEDLVHVDWSEVWRP